MAKFDVSKTKKQKFGTTTIFTEGLEDTPLKIHKTFFDSTSRSGFFKSSKMYDPFNVNWRNFVGFNSSLHQFYKR